MHMVQKAAGDWRPCEDYNHWAGHTGTCIPHIQDLQQILLEREISPKSIFVQGYHQIPVAAEDISKTAILQLILGFTRVRGYGEFLPHACRSIPGTACLMLLYFLMH